MQYMVTKRFLLFTLVLLLAGILTWWVNRPPVLTAVLVQQAPLVRTLQFSARVATPSRVDLGSTITGRVRQVEVKEGDRIRAGEVLVRMENDELRAALAQAQAAEQQAAARLNGLRSTGRSSAEAAVAQAASVLVSARNELLRAQDLVAQGFVSAARLDEAQRVMSVAQAQWDSAKAQQAANAEQGSDLVQAQAQLALAQAARQGAEHRLAQATLRAPAEGQVLVRSVEPGRIVQPGSALLTMTLAGTIQLVATVDERYLDQLQIGQMTWVVADAFPHQRFTARLRSISPWVNAKQGSIEVKFDLQGPPPDFLREDMSLSVEVETAKRAQALWIPITALRADGPPDATQALVHVADNGRVVERAVQLGLRTLDAVEVLNGLSVSEQVLIGPTPAPGRRVRIQVISVAGAQETRPMGSGSRDNAGSAMSNTFGR